GAETPDEHLTHEVLGRLVAARVVEVQDHRAVEESRLAEELDLLLECGEQLRSALGPHHLRRVTVEREAHGFETTRIRELAHEPQHCLVAEMDAVIRTDRDGATACARGDVLESDDLHLLHADASCGATTTAGRSAAPRRSYTASSSPPGSTTANGPAPSPA